MLKKWLPFSVLLLIILISTGYLFFGKTASDYKPGTGDPHIIYREACMHCHGDNGQGTGLLYPAFEDHLTSAEIIDVLNSGSFMMPSFKNIKGDTLKALIHYIESKSYKTH